MRSSDGLERALDPEMGKDRSRSGLWPGSPNVVMDGDQMAGKGRKGWKGKHKLKRVG